MALGRSRAPRADKPVPRAAYPRAARAEALPGPPYPECRRLRFTLRPAGRHPRQQRQDHRPGDHREAAEDGYVRVSRPRPGARRTATPHGRRGAPAPREPGSTRWSVAPRPVSGRRRGEDPRAATRLRLLVHATDTWQINLHAPQATPRTETLWLVYDVDFVPGPPREPGIRNVIAVVDVRRDSDRPAYPVFNVQRG